MGLSIPFGIVSPCVWCPLGVVALPGVTVCLLRAVPCVCPSLLWHHLLATLSQCLCPPALGLCRWPLVRCHKPCASLGLLSPPRVIPWGFSCSSDGRNSAEGTSSSFASPLQPGQWGPGDSPRAGSCGWEPPAHALHPDGLAWPLGPGWEQPCFPSSEPGREGLSCSSSHQPCQGPTGMLSLLSAPCLSHRGRSFPWQKLCVPPCPCALP